MTVDEQQDKKTSEDVDARKQMDTLWKQLFAFVHERSMQPILKEILLVSQQHQNRRQLNKIDRQVEKMLNQIPKEMDQLERSKTAAAPLHEQALVIAASDTHRLSMLPILKKLLLVVSGRYHPQQHCKTPTIPSQLTKPTQAFSYYYDRRPQCSCK